MPRTSRLTLQGAASSHRGPLTAVITAGVCCAAFLASGSSLEAEAARAQAQAGPFTVAVTITNSVLNVVPSTVPAGAIVFKVVNRARIARDFEIAGKKTPIIRTSKSAILRAVVMQRPYRYVSVAPRHAPLTGLLGVLKACANPTTSTVEVQITAGVITLSQSTVPCGTVTFVVTSRDPAAQSLHSFDISVPTNVNGGVPLLHPGETAKMTINIPFEGKVYYGDGVGRNAELGGEGFLIVD